MLDPGLAGRALDQTRRAAHARDVVAELGLDPRLEPVIPLAPSNPGPRAHYDRGLEGLVCISQEPEPQRTVDIDALKKMLEAGSQLHDLTIDPTWFVRPDGRDASQTIHGVGHTARVLIHAMELADAIGLSAGEREALGLAAIWHDIGRTNDGADYYHGAKSAGKVVGLGLHHGVDPQVLETALFAITHHSGSEEHAERGASWFDDPESTLRVFRVLKDADGLDRVRLGDLDPTYLRFPQSQSRVARAWELLRERP